ncbi:MAG: MAPEG family protein, partial [Betaproteobacteria bacterium]
RVVQSSIHLASLSVIAVNARFTAFAIQIAIAVYWACALIVK